MTPVQKNIYHYLLSTDGVNQTRRAQPALDPANVKIESRSLSELIRFVNGLATQVRYYDTFKNQQGDWLAFFEQLRSGSEVLTDEQLEALLTLKTDLSPHLALLLAYLKIYSIAKDDLNAVVKKRLDYYYEEVLQLKRRPANPDKVHLLFELGKNAKPQLMKAGIMLDGGKTTTGLPLHYALQNDIVVSHTTVGQIRSSFQDFTSNGKGMVFRANDATQVQNNTGTGWKPFGSGQLSLSPDSRPMDPVSFGWGFASPNLLLAEGKRKILLTIAMVSLRGHTFPEFALTPFVTASLTGEKEWLNEEISVQEAKIIPGIPVGLQDPALENPFTFKITVNVNETAPAITYYNEEVHMGMYNTVWPVLQLLLTPDSFLLESLSIFRVTTVKMEVQVTGVKDLVLQNDQALQPSDKPSLPFGNIPVVGANFYIGSKEVFSKSLTSLNVKLEWQDPPADMAVHYSAYGSPSIQNNKFTTALDLLSKRNWNLRLLPNHSLFNSTDTSLIKELEVNKTLFASQTINAPFERDPELEVSDGFTNNVNQGFARVVLTGPTAFSSGNMPVDAPFEAFGHKTFPVAYTQKVIELSKWDGTGTAPELPKEPYVPTLKSVSVDYTAEVTFQPNDPNDIDQYFIQDIFGPGETKKDDTVLLLPPQPIEGALYIALENSTAAETVSLLLQIEEGSVESDTLLRSAEISWSYLAGNQWKEISAPNVLEDSTGGMQKPGLIRLNIGSDASLQHSLMTPGMHWIRASVEDNPGGAASVVKISGQAAKGELVLPGSSAAGYEEHLSSPLLPGSISKLIKKIPSIKKILQPYPSFDGRNPETDEAFYRRVSERLRHKNRAVSGWDYERLLLENFPGIYKVKCLPHSDTEESFRPGDVRLVVVPDWRKRPTGDPLQPKVNQNSLREMDDFISYTFTSPLVRVYVTNPTYETLLVDCKVSFHPEFDPGYYATVLNEDIKKFLSPWAYEEGQDIVFGGKVYASEILAFIEGKEYVDFVTDFELYHRFQGTAGGGIGDMQIGLDFIIGYSPEPSIANLISSVFPPIEIGGKTINIDFVIGEPVQIAAATRPDSILVSNITHRIEAVQAEGSSCQGVQQIGIGQMIIGLDFIPI